jgi:RES domain-containing protein
VYTSEHLSLAALEVLVHAQGRSALADLLCLEIAIPSGMSETLAIADLPTDWRSPDPPLSLRDVGTRWLAEQRSVALRVPSAVVAKEYNVLLNPRHPDFTRLKATTPEPFDFDPRLNLRREA